MASEDSLLVDVEKNRLNRLRKWMQENEMIASHVAVKLGTSKAAISQLLSESRPIREKKAREIEDRLGMEPFYLDNKEGEIFITGYDFDRCDFINPNKHQSLDYLVLPRQWLEHLFLFHDEKNLRFIYHEGDSMEPTIRDGDYAIVDVSINKVKGNGIYCLGEAGNILIKRVHIDIGKALYSTSDNPRYPSIALGGLEITVLGKVVATQAITKILS